ncbi:MAG TPA: hypothetical protein VIR81_01380 [Myxococcales bacterium]
MTRGNRSSREDFARCAGLALAAAGLVAQQGCSSQPATIAPLAWQKVEGPGPRGAVLGLGSPGAFDEVGNFTISAFKDGATYRLYYGGADVFGTCPGINSSHWRIGLATSDDGLHWTRVTGTQAKGSIVDNGASGSFDSYLTYRPFVLKDGSLYRMWYNGSDKPFNDCHAPAGQGPLADDRRIGYAESSDGVTWTKKNDGPGPDGSVLPLGPAGAFDAQQVGYVWVIKDTSDYKMYYSANDATNTWRVGLAISTDGRTWTKRPGKLRNTPAVLDLGAAGSFDFACAYQPSVVKENDSLYRMWYRGCAAPSPLGGPSGGVIGYAESNDGITWIKMNGGGANGAAVTAGAAGQFDSGGLTTPSVFLDGSTWRMYYAGFDTGGVFLTGLAEAPRQ